MTGPFTSLKRIKRKLFAGASPVRHGTNCSYIFIHINKTAGTSIGNAIGLDVKQHLTAKEVISRVGQEQWDSAYKFTFVRNPWDRAVSLYEYRRKKNKTQIATKGIEFTEWVNYVFSDHPDPYFHNNPKSFQPQVEWLKDDNGRVTVDFVGRFESINKDFDRIKELTGSSANLPHLNASKRTSYQSYYDADTRALVHHWFHQDIALFGYSFD